MWITSDGARLEPLTKLVRFIGSSLVTGVLMQMECRCTGSHQDPTIARPTQGATPPPREPVGPSIQPRWVLAMLESNT